MRTFELNEVVALLRQDVESEGGQIAWSKKTGINRTLLNQVLNGHRLPTGRIIAALDLRIVIVRGRGGWVKELPRGRAGRQHQDGQSKVSATIGSKRS